MQWWSNPVANVDANEVFRDFHFLRAMGGGYWQLRPEAEIFRYCMGATRRVGSINYMLSSYRRCYKNNLGLYENWRDMHCRLQGQLYDALLRFLPVTSK